MAESSEQSYEEMAYSHMKRQNNYCRALVISNECLSETSSNGRTLRNYFTGWPAECLAQFYIQKGEPDFDACSNYFCVTDRQALASFRGKKIGNGRVQYKTEASESVRSESLKAQHGRNALTMLVRELVWSCGSWKRYGFEQWVEEFAPQVVVLQAGDCGFMFQLALKICGKFDIPLVIFNSEGYYFKDYDYFRASGIAHLCYPVFRANLKRKTAKAIRYAYCSVYLCDALKKVYDEVFDKPSCTIYTATEVKKLSDKRADDQFVVSYLGNLGVGRHEPLVKIANILQEISPEILLNVYGRIPNRSVEEAFQNCPGIRYKGFVSYEDVLRVMQESDLLVHGESFDSFYREDLKFGFSTKIADTLASGRKFLLFAPEEIACASYLRDNNAAYVASGEDDLRAVLNEIYADRHSPNKFEAAASKLVVKNHDAAQNSTRFQEIIIESVGGR